MKVGIVGGSIAGLATAVALKNIGCNVTVIERSEHSLSDRGAGIVLPEPLIQQCIDADLFDSTLSRLTLSSRSFITRDNQNIFEQSFKGRGLNWADLYKQLRKRLPSTCYKAGENVTEIIQSDQACQVKTQNGHTFDFDYVIAADGFDSSLRKQIFPEHQPEYVGYIAWRGTIPMSKVKQPSLFESHVPYYVYPNGHILFYHIPDSSQQNTKNSLLNWVMYEPLEHAKINHAHSIPPGGLSTEQLSHLHSFAKEHLPKEISEIILDTEKPFLQAIYDSAMSCLVSQRICFIGDAASVLRPHTASGVLKALQDALSLKKLFSESPQTEITQALDQWNTSQIAYLEQQVTLSKNMGKALVTHTPNWNNMTPESMQTWWQAVVAGKTWYLTKPKNPSLPVTEDLKEDVTAGEAH